MKKIFYLLFLLPLAFAVSSCSNDDDLPQVDLTLSISNVYQDASNSRLYYVVEEETESPVIESFSAKSLLSGKDAAVTNVHYLLNNRFPLFGTEEDPWTPVIPASQLVEGVNYINIAATVLQEDKSISYFRAEVPLTVVTEENLPANVGDLGTYEITMRMKNDK